MRRSFLSFRCLQTCALACALLALPAAAHAERLTGTLRVVHADDPAHGVSHDSYLLQTATGRVPLKPGSADLGSLAGDRVQVTGQPSGDALVVSGGSSGLQALTAAPNTLGLGSHTVAVILLTGTWGGSVPTATQADQTVFSGPTSVNAFYQEESWGKLSLTGAVFGPYAVPD